MVIGVSQRVLYGSGSRLNLPPQALDFESGSSQYLSRTSVNLGAYDRQTFGFFMHLTRESVGNHYLYYMSSEIQLQFTASNTIEWWVRGDDLSINRISTLAVFEELDEYMTLQVVYDSTQVVTSDRMQIYLNSKRVIDFATESYPTLNRSANDSGNPLFVGRDITSHDGLIYQNTMFSGSNPTPSELKENDDRPTDISELVGTYFATYGTGGDPTNDEVLGTSWTNNNAVTTSDNIPVNPPSVIPTKSFDLTSSTGKYLRIPQTSFGNFNQKKFGYKLSIQRSFLTAATQKMLHKEASFFCHFNGSDQIDIYMKAVGGATSSLVTNITYTSLTSFYEILVLIDTTQVTASDRMQLWVDGVRVVSFATNTQPALNADIELSANDVYIGSEAGSQQVRGEIYQTTFFSGDLPTASEISNSGSPKDISRLPSIYSAPWALNDVKVRDDILSQSWIDNGMSLSTNIPS